MSAMPEPAPPVKRETFADWVARDAGLPRNVTEAGDQDISPFVAEFWRRVRDHGGYLQTLSGVEKFTRERWPIWYSRSGKDFVKCLWSEWLSHEEREQ